MARSRKTINVASALDMANHFLLHTPNDMQDDRRGVSSFIESVLNATGNYNGFKYLDANDMKHSQNGTAQGIDNDGTRIQYFDSHLIRTDREFSKA